jgi:hypothetical protein
VILIVVFAADICAILSVAVVVGWFVVTVVIITWFTITVVAVSIWFAVTVITAFVTFVFFVGSYDITGCFSVLKQTAGALKLTIIHVHGFRVRILDGCGVTCYDITRSH